MKLFHSLLTFAAAFSLALTAWGGVRDLPVTVRDGVAYHYYQVQPKETIYSLSRKLGLTRQEMERYNPSLVDGLKANTTLYFPVEEGEYPSRTITHEVKKGETVYGLSRQYGLSIDQFLAQNPGARDGLKAGMILTITTPASDGGVVAPEVAAAPVPEPAPAPEIVIEPRSVPEEQIPIVAEDEFSAASEPVAAEQTPRISPVRIAVVLPFELDRVTPSKEGALYTEFFKGMLVAADSMRRGDAPVMISAYDCGPDVAATRRMLASNPELATMQVIVLPPKEDQLKVVADFARDNSLMALNAFAVRDSSQLANPAVMQMNLPSGEMYDRAIRAMRRTHAAHTPVVLTRSGGPADHAEFIAVLKAAYGADGLAVKEISYTDRLKASDLASLGDDPTASWVFIPASGKQAELNKILPALLERQEQASMPSNIALMGYPEWILYKGETLNNLQQLGATVYSRFFAEPDSPDVERVEEAYARWYGSRMENKVPRQGLTGFDTARYLISALRDNCGDFSIASPALDGTQYGFDFRRDGAGWVNNTLFLVNFGPGSLVTRQTTYAGQ